ncbi:Protein of unknown function DUF1677 [Macleaya cordata]|uniref:DUF1677 domain-containing protein n=1 Tax=Macleaya cordata TaxID=56857 RepID=A0A200RC47_MACCD|nr:Protein of unknown function DUF1677 [Macleaya cordata]
MSDEGGLRRIISDVSNEINKLREQDYDFVMIKTNEVERAKCECCGMIEECTFDYIERVRNSYCGKWICGICSEAVKERLTRHQGLAMEEALSSHYELCHKFNITTRLNPKLSLARTMRDIAKKSSQGRSSKNTSSSSSIPKIARSSSCFSRIDLE